jgi:chemotaxis protein methyltransferase CheR
MRTVSSHPLLREALRASRLTARACWHALPESVLSTWPFRKLGKLIHKAHIRWQLRVPLLQITYFLRNEPLLEVLRDLALKLPNGRDWRVISVGCSTGAELYSLLWYLRSARPDLRISAVGVDIADTVVAKARGGEYLRTDDEMRFLSNAMIEAMFDQAVDAIKVKDWLRKDVRWLVADGMDPDLPDLLGSADLVLANNLFLPLSDEKAESFMDNLLRLVSPGGYFVLNGNLDVKTRFAKKNRLVPLSDRIEAVHFGDPTKMKWPWKHTSPEPIEKWRPDWQTRYAQIFVKPSDDGVAQSGLVGSLIHVMGMQSNDVGIAPT